MKKFVSIFVVVWISVLSPAVAWAQETADAQGNPTGPTEPVGPQEPTGPQGEVGPSCVGTSCAVSEEDYAAWEARVADSGMQGINTNTGEDSTNSVTSDVDSSTDTSVKNSVTDTTKATVTGSTGGNTASSNTGLGGTQTGNAAIGVTSLKQDNTAVIGGSAGLDVSSQSGGSSDYMIGFSGATGDLSGGQSYKAVNDTTGAGSTNAVDLSTSVEEINEVQNDGKILNDLVLKAVTGQNTASMNTGDGAIATGNADIAATLVNLLNTTVINGALMVSVADIFGDLMGNIVLPDLAALAALIAATAPAIMAGNENTGADSLNTIDVDLTNTETTEVVNDADITTTLTATAITGQNTAEMNTGGGMIETGNGSASLANISVANTTVEGGNWGLVVVNAFNRWLGFLVGDGGQVVALSQEQTIEAINASTGNDSDNTIAISDERERTTHVTNTAEIVNEVDATAITGQNVASMNTGQGKIATGDANVTATAVNIANTTVKDASLFIAVVNIFGDWFGDLLYGGTSLLASAHSTSSGQAANVDAANKNTGSESTNTIDVDIDRSQTTDIDNDADIATTLHATIDTGTNKTNKNTKGASVTTGNGELALHSRALANLTGIALDPVLGISISGLNDTTGFDSTNTIKATLNDERIVAVDNFADVSTLFASLVNTGDNEMLMNTLAGPITTGNIDANVGIHNLINRVILALSGGGFAADGTLIDADFMNRLTGALSDNSNELEVDYDLLADIVNKGLVDNLLDLIFNTGGNTASMNTGALSAAGLSAVGGGPSITTGRVCFTGDVNTNVNQTSFDLGGWWSVNLDSNADVNNEANISATTGNNVLSDNTGGGGDGETEGCPKLALAPSPTPAPPVGGGEQPPAGGAAEGPSEGGVGGEPFDEAQGKEAKVAALRQAQGKPGKINGGAILRRFPVAGSLVESRWLAGARKPMWPVFALGAIGILGLAYHLDRQARRQRQLTLAH